MVYTCFYIRIVGTTSWGENSGQGLVPSEATVWSEAKAAGDPPCRA